MPHRCEWVPQKDQLYIDYHDQEWGTPVYDDQKLFEFLVLETFQAGLSWRIILGKRDGFKQAFGNFAPKLVARFTEQQQEQLRSNPDIVRNRLKIAATVNNAQRFLEIQQEFGTFSKYMWGFVGGEPIVNKWGSISEVPAITSKAEEMSKDLKQRGFKFLGPTVCYAHMQAVGMVNDHTVDCFRYKKLAV